MKSWLASKLTLDNSGRLLALLIVAWAPFIGGGSRIPSLLLAILGAWLLVKYWGELLNSRSHRRLFIIFALLWVPVVLSVPGSFHVKDSVIIVILLPLFFLAGVAMLHVLRHERDLGWMNKWISLVLCLWVIDGLVQYFVGKDLLMVPLSPEGRVVGFFGTNLRMSVFLATLAPILLWWALRRHVAWVYLAYGLVVWVVVLSGARGSWLMVILAGMLFIYTARIPYKIPATLAVVVVFGFFAWQSPIVKTKVWQTGELTSLDFKTLDTVLTKRMVIWDTAKEMFMDRPLLGVGTKAFDEAYDSYASRVDDPFIKRGAKRHGVYHAHQMYVTIMAESGLVGLVGLGAIICLCIRWYLALPKAQRHRARPYALGLLVVAFPLNSQPPLYKAWWFPLMLLLLCMMLAALECKNSNAKSN